MYLIFIICHQKLTCWNSAEHSAEPVPPKQGGKGMRKTTALLLKQQASWKRNFWRCYTLRKFSSSRAAAGYPRSKTPAGTPSEKSPLKLFINNMGGKKKAHKLFLKWIIRMILLFIFFCGESSNCPENGCLKWTASERAKFFHQFVF